MPEVPETEAEEEQVTTVTEGYFEEEYYVDSETAGEFLVSLGEQLRDDDELTVSGDDWELPFAFGEPVKLDVEFEGDDSPELEIEAELEGRVEDDDAPSLS